jgi:3'-5' exonuclease
MATLIFDIKTVGEKWEHFDSVTKHTLTHYIERVAKAESEKELLLQEIKANLGFSPLTGTLVAIGVYDVERQQGAVYYTGQGTEVDEEVAGYIFKQRSEQEMLEEFFEGARSYDTFVSFNGRSFSLPFLLHRAVVRGVQPLPELLEKRYLSQQRNIIHIDLLDQLTFYGAMNRRPSLHLFCRAYGIVSPKQAEESENSVEELFSQKKFREVALVSSREVTAISELYDKWCTYLAPTTFLNSADY